MRKGSKRFGPCSRCRSTTSVFWKGEMNWWPNPFKTKYDLCRHCYGIAQRLLIDDKWIFEALPVTHTVPVKKEKVN